MSPSFLRNAGVESNIEAEIFIYLCNGKKWKYIRIKVDM